MAPKPQAPWPGRGQGQGRSLAWGTGDSSAMASPSPGGFLAQRPQALGSSQQRLMGPQGQGWWEGRIGQGAGCCSPCRRGGGGGAADLPHPRGVPRDTARQWGPPFSLPSWKWADAADQGSIVERGTHSLSACFKLAQGPQPQGGKAPGVIPTWQMREPGLRAGQTRAFAHAALSTCAALPQTPQGSPSPPQQGPS